MSDLVQISTKGSLRSDGKRVAIHPADLHGPWQTRRRVVYALLVLIYIALPWIPVGGHPAVFLDLGARRFHLFGLAFNAQDTWLMIFLVGGGLLALLFLTALAGRVWCGWGCPQTVWLEGVFRPIQRWIEGPRAERLRREAGPWTLGRVARKVLLHAIYALVAAALAHVFLAYFVSLPRLWSMMQQAPAAHFGAFLVVFGLAAVLYFDFAWFREQFCVVMCPYGRLQSVLIDRDSLVVGYDQKRGEPRGKLKDPARGACVDCKRCVVVCPTGIDIRDGLQMDCIACTACIDACDEIMDKTGQARGLIRYASQRALEGGKTRVLRPRVIAYGVLLAGFATAATLAFGTRSPVEANLLRQPGAPFVLDGARVRNGFELHLVNKHPAPVTFTVRAAAELPGETLTMPVATWALAPLEQARAPIFVERPRGAGLGPVRLELSDDAGGRRVLTAPFLGP